MRKSVLALCLGLALVAGLFYGFKGDTVSAQQFPTPCIPLLGVTSGISVSTLDALNSKAENAGIMYFSQGYSITENDYVESVPYPDQRVCVIDLGPQASDNTVRYVFQGWTIDSNLGWVSWACKNGKNLDKHCSSKGIDYQVEMTQGGRLQGFAYADTAGWISFYCRTGKNLMNGAQFSCGNVDYSVQIDKTENIPNPPNPALQNPTPPPTGVDSNKAYYKIDSANIKRHAWADSVGWFDMFGLQVPFGAILDGNVTECANGKDDDGDGKIDLADPDCKDSNDAKEGPTQCSDGKDNDGDHRIDYGFPWLTNKNDSGCSSFEDDDESDDPVLKFACEDGIDNDGDGKVDLADPGCFKKEDNIENDVACSDGKDNDGDGKIDYLQDDGCEGDPEGPSESNTLPAACNDGVDNDGDGKIDFNGKDTNGDGVIDIQADDGCWGLADPGEQPTACSDGVDNDGDGKKDLNDSGCANYEDANEADDAVPVSACSDGIDNDGDKLKDYPERGCYSPVDNSEEDKQCDDWADNDGDGFIDYNGKGSISADPQCTFGDDDSEFVPECSDGIDNDGDGKMDMGVNLDADPALEIPADEDCTDPQDLKEGPDNCADLGKNLQECLQVPQYGSYLTVYPNPYTNPVVADGASEYKIVVHLGVGATTYDEASYTYDPQPKDWLEQFLDVKLYTDQTDSSTALSWADLKQAGLVKPFKFYAVDDKGLPLNSWVAYVQSPVPTTGIKTSLIVKPKSLDLTPVDSQDPTKGWLLNGNSLKLARFKIDKILNGSGDLQPGSCSLSNEPASCGLVSKESQLQGTKDGSTDLRFSPIVVLKKLTSQGQRYIDAINGVTNNIEAEATYKGDANSVFKKANVVIDFLASAYETANAANTFIYEWIDTGTGTVSNITDPTATEDSSLTLNPVSGFLDVLLNLSLRPMVADGVEETGEYVGQTSLLALGKYVWGAKNVVYVPDGLPDTQNEGIYNPGADIVGLIYSKVLDIPKEDNKYYSTGNLTSNVLRDTVMANLAALPKPNVDSTKDLIISNSCPDNDNKATGQINGDLFYYVQGKNVILGDVPGGQMDCGKHNNIVVVKGGNVFIDSNLYSEAQGRGKWTIIALRSNYGIESFKEGGNIYINNQISTIYANIMADGSVFSYHGEKDTNNFQVDGRPKTELTDEDLQKQVYFLGSIASWNTFGGSLKIDSRPGATDAKPYVLGNGQFTSDQELARVYDLNYLRRFKLYLERYNGVVIDQYCKFLGVGPAEQASLVNAGNQPACYSINAQEEFDPYLPDDSGDLIDVNTDGVSLRAPTLIPFSNAPVVIKYEQPDAENPLFKLRKGNAFVRPNF